MRTLCAALSEGARGRTKTLLDILTQCFISLEARSTGQGALAFPHLLAAYNLMAEDDPGREARAARTVSRYKIRAGTLHTQ